MSGWIGIAPTPSTQGVHSVRPPTRRVLPGQSRVRAADQFRTQIPFPVPSNAQFCGDFGALACQPLCFGFGLQSGGPSRMALSQHPSRAHMLPDNCYVEATTFYWPASDLAIRGRLHKFATALAQRFVRHRCRCHPPLHLSNWQAVDWLGSATIFAASSTQVRRCANLQALCMAQRFFRRKSDSPSLPIPPPPASPLP